MDKNNDQKQKILNHLKEPIFRMILTKFEEIWISLLDARALLRFFLKKGQFLKMAIKWPQLVIYGQKGVQLFRKNIFYGFKAKKVPKKSLPYFHV